MNGMGVAQRNTPPAQDPRAVANYVLDACDIGGVRDVSNMKLQKLVYLAHREHLGVFGAPLVKLGFEAWEHGPVSPIIYQSFKAAGSVAISTRATMIDLRTGHDIVVRHDFPPSQEGIMDVILGQYGRMSASSLRALTHQGGGAWDGVWQARLSEPAGTKISDETILLEYQRGTRRIDG